jgi:hypothetical protein
MALTLYGPQGALCILIPAQSSDFFVSRLYHDRFIEILAGLFDSLDDFGSHLAKDLRLAQVCSNGRNS